MEHCSFRNIMFTEGVSKAAEFIRQSFDDYGLSTSEQGFKVRSSSSWSIGGQLYD